MAMTTTKMMMMMIDGDDDVHVDVDGHQYSFCRQYP